jgi:hypothetical protein
MGCDDIGQATLLEKLGNRRDTARVGVLKYVNQREEVVQIMQDSYYGILEVVGR